MIRILKELGVEKNFLIMIKGIYEKPTANVTLSHETLKAFPLRSGRRPGCLLSPLPFKVMLEALARAFRE